MISDGKPILDACCGSRMFWFDKDNPLVDFQDIREEDCVLPNGRYLLVHPNFLGDYTNMSMPDKSYKLVIFDPPHLINPGINSIYAKKYGRLERNSWKDNIKKGFNECMRVLDDYGVLIFKWSDIDAKVKSVIQAIGQVPLVGHKTSRHCIWMVFMKLPIKNNEQL